MSLTRTTLLALTAAIALGSAMASTDASAKGGNGGNGGMGGWHQYHHNHHAYWPNYRRHYYYAAPVVYSAYRRPVVAAAPNPCSCLSKAYTPEGQVVFSDNCTKESAMAPVPGVQQQSEAAPQNFAGKTFQDFQNSQRQ